MLLNQYQEFINNNINNANIKIVVEKDGQIDVKFYINQDLWYEDGSSNRKIPADTLVGKTFFELDDEDWQEYVENALASGKFTKLVDLNSGDFENMLEEESEKA